MPLNRRLSKTEIAARIPHAHSMCLLEAVEHWDAEHIVCTAISHQDPHNPLREAGRLGAACGVEYAAQAMAVHGALLAGFADDTRPRTGFLASMRDVQLHVARLDNLAAPLRIEATRLSGDGHNILYSFSVRCAQQQIVTGRAAVMLSADNAKENSQ